jgi:F-type H+-transporting ATPase subunit delta
MSLRTSATRYAKALLEVALSESDPSQVERDLSTIVGAMNDHAELQRVLSSPRTSSIARTNIVNALAARASVQPPVGKLLALLADRGRLVLLPELLVVYRERLLAHRNIVQATVTSAAPLASDKVQALTASLGGVTGRTVQLDATVDPSIIGGVVARIGSTIYDGSIRTQLARMRRQIVEKA